MIPCPTCYTVLKEVNKGKGVHLECQSCLATCTLEGKLETKEDKQIRREKYFLELAERRKLAKICKIIKNKLCCPLCNSQLESYFSPQLDSNLLRCPNCSNKERYSQEGKALDTEDKAALSEKRQKAKEEKQRARYGGYLSYQEYLKSDIWKNKRTEIFILYDYKCYVCGDNKELHCHHKSYDRVGKELNEDLVPLCKLCHDFLHWLCNRDEADIIETEKVFTIEDGPDKIKKIFNTQYCDELLMQWRGETKIPKPKTPSQINKKLHLEYSCTEDEYDLIMEIAEHERDMDVIQEDVSEEIAFTIKNL